LYTFPSFITNSTFSNTLMFVSGSPLTATRSALAWRWFTGLGFDQEIPHHSTFPRGYHAMTRTGNLFNFEQRCGARLTGCIELREYREEKRRVA
jgi:Transposase domain (DUF772)